MAYSFTVENSQKSRGSKILQIGSPHEGFEKSTLVLGQMKTLFGEPLYITEDVEDMFSYCIAAKDENENTLYLEVYSGSTGPAIGGNASSAEAYDAARQLATLIVSATPSDYDYKGIYADYCICVRMGVKNGQPYQKGSLSVKLLFKRLVMCVGMLVKR